MGLSWDHPTTLPLPPVDGHLLLSPWPHLILMPHLPVTGVPWFLTTAPWSRSGTAMGLHPGGAATAQLLSCSQLSAAAQQPIAAIAFFQAVCHRAKPHCFSGRLGNPTAPPGYRVHPSISARAFFTGRCELPVAAGEHGPQRRRK